jgi:hypothetical protein
MFRPRSLEEALLVVVRQRLADGRFRVLQWPVVFLEAVPEPGMAQDLPEDRQFAVDVFGARPASMRALTRRRLLALTPCIAMGNGLYTHSCTRDHVR